MEQPREPIFYPNEISCSIGMIREKEKKTAFHRKQSFSQDELQYLREYADKSVIAAFANHKLLRQ